MQKMIPAQKKKITTRDNVLNPSFPPPSLNLRVLNTWVSPVNMSLPAWILSSADPWAHLTKFHAYLPSQAKKWNLVKVKYSTHFAEVPVGILIFSLFVTKQRFGPSLTQLFPILWVSPGQLQLILFSKRNHVFTSQPTLSFIICFQYDCVSWLVLAHAVPVKRWAAQSCSKYLILPRLSAANARVGLMSGQFTSLWRKTKLTRTALSGTHTSAEAQQPPWTQSSLYNEANKTTWITKSGWRRIFSFVIVSWEIRENVKKQSHNVKEMEK